jgi:predicted transposase/invertase (TIGR01784 family)
MVFNCQYLPKADIVFTVMFLNKRLCEKTLEAILGEKLELIDIVAESKNDLHKAALNAIYFDIKTKTTDGRIVTLDLQRKYIKDRVRKRTVYYACREISSQEVKKGKYENLKNVVVTFLLTEASLKNTKDNRCIQLKDSVSGDVYSDILTIHEVNIQHIGNENSEALQILKAFFEIETQEDFDRFTEQYEKNAYGKLLLDSYIEATRNSTLLDSLSKEDKYMIRLTDEERLEEREEGRVEGREEGLTKGREEGKKDKAIEIAVNLMNMNMSLASISQVTGLSKEEIESL